MLLKRTPLAIPVLYLLAVVASMPSYAAEQTTTSCTVPGRNWSMADLTQAGWSKEKLALAHQYADSIHSDSVVI
ncbi:hypothetical protein C1Y12_29885, partial [Pseudomonas sp. FW305-47B]